MSQNQPQLNMIETLYRCHPAPHQQSQQTEQQTLRLGEPRGQFDASRGVQFVYLPPQPQPQQQFIQYNHFTTPQMPSSNTQDLALCGNLKTNFAPYQIGTNQVNFSHSMQQQFQQPVQIHQPGAGGFTGIHTLEPRSVPHHLFQQKIPQGHVHNVVAPVPVVVQDCSNSNPMPTPVYSFVVPVDHRSGVSMLLANGSHPARPPLEKEESSKSKDRNTPLPPRWMNADIITAFSVDYKSEAGGKSNYTTDVIEKGFLFHFLKRCKYPLLTPKQYRAALRKVVFEDRDNLNEELLSLLTKHIDLLGRSHWGFKRFVFAGPDLPGFRREQAIVEAKAAELSVFVKDCLEREQSTKSKGAENRDTVNKDREKKRARDQDEEDTTASYSSGETTKSDNDKALPKRLRKEIV